MFFHTDFMTWEKHFVVFLKTHQEVLFSIVSFWNQTKMKAEN